MDADLFGGTLSSKKTSNGRPSGKPTTPRLATSNSKGNISPTRVQVGWILLFANAII